MNQTIQFSRMGTSAARWQAGCRRWPERLVTLLALVVCTALAPSASAQQTVTVQAQPVRVTVPDTSTNTAIITNLVTFGGGSFNQVNLSISGLPAGANASFDVTAFTNTGGATLTLNTTNVPHGEHVLSIDATGGAENHFLLTLQSGRVWNGDTNVTGNWSAATSWVGGVPPGPGNDVVFTHLGAQTNATAAGFTNAILDVDAQIASLRFSQSNGTARFHTLHINPGRTLAVTGTRGFRMLRDYTGVGAQMNVNITGDGTLAVSNENANVAITIDNQQNHTLNLSGLGTFAANVNRVGFGDYRLYPNYTNLQANGFGGNATFLIPRRFIPTVNLARTNIIRAVHVDPNDYMHPAFRDYSLTLGNNEIGTTADSMLLLGISNAFFLDSICLVQSSAQSDPAAGGIRFNPAFATNNPTASFRGRDGGRMSVFAIADAAGPGPSGTGTKAIVNLSGGTVDALVDRLYLGRDRTNSSDGATAEATLTLAKGVFDVNTAILGYQSQGNNQNVGGADQRNYCRGVLNVATTAVFIVNQTLELGHTTASPLHPSQAEQGYGQLNVTNATVMANTITIGGVTRVSLNNFISLAGGAQLIVSNTIADPDKRLTTLTMSDSRLTLHVDGSITTPYVYVTNLVTSGTANLIELASVTGFTSYPTQVALISYVAASPTFSVSLPAGLFGFIVNNTANKTIDVVLSTNAPKTVLWRGTQNGNWDTATSNWVDSMTLAPANFNNGDFVVFDDTATGPTTVNVVGSVIPGQSPTTPGVTVNNSSKSYTFTGGTIAGTGTMLKQGTGTLTVDATSENPLNLTQGAVDGVGVIGSTTVSSGAALTFAGTIAGLASTGSVTLASSGVINGPVSIYGSTFVNAGTVTTTPGTMTIGSGVLVTNLLSGTLNVLNAWAVSSNSTLANFGHINNVNNRLNINAGASLVGTGTVSDMTGVANGNQGRLAINSGAIFSPGDPPASPLGTFVVEGRLDLNQASGGSPAGRLVIEVDLNDPLRNDVVGVDKWSNIRGTIVMTNIGTVPFAAGQSFLIVSNNFGLLNTPEVANLDYTFDPPSPGLGLIWDTTDLITNGIVKIGTTSAVATNILFSKVSSNAFNLSWSESHRGWVLQTQNNPTTIGISNNWMDVLNSRLSNSVNVPVVTNAGRAIFYRLIHP